jgi:hypothetical protein
MLTETCLAERVVSSFPAAVGTWARGAEDGEGGG